MRVLCVFPQYNYGDPARGEGIEYCAFLPAFRNLGYEAIHFEPWDRARFTTFADLNRGLVDAVHDLEPDIVFTVQRDYEIWTETLATIREQYGVTCITWATDDNWKYSEVSRHIAGFYDIVATTYDEAHARYLADGFTHCVLTQWGANRHWLRAPKTASECSRQVTFIGAAHGGRGAHVAALRKAGIPVECFGFGWDHGPVAASAIPEIVRDSYISLNFAANYSPRKGPSKQIKARTFEVPGAGGLLCTEYTPGLERYFENMKEVVSWESAGECIDRIRYLLAHPGERDRIARAGFERTAASHLYDERLAHVLHSAGNLKSVSARPLDWKCVLGTHDARTRHWSVRLARRLLLTVAGSKARPLCFAISRRLSPSRTFSSAGWPGILLPMA